MSKNAATKLYKNALTEAIAYVRWSYKHNNGVIENWKTYEDKLYLAEKACESVGCAAQIKERAEILTIWR